MGPGKRYQKSDGTGSIKTYEELVGGGFNPDDLVKEGRLKIVDETVAPPSVVNETQPVKKKVTDVSESSPSPSVSSTNQDQNTNQSVSDGTGNESNAGTEVGSFADPGNQPIPQPKITIPIIGDISNLSRGNADQQKPVITTADDINKIQESLFNDNNIRSSSIAKDAFAKTVPDVAKDLHQQDQANIIADEPNKKEEYIANRIIDLQTMKVDTSLKIDPFLAIKADITAPGNMSTAMVGRDENGSPVLDPVTWITESPERLSKYYDLRQADIQNKMIGLNEDAKNEINPGGTSAKRINLMRQQNILDASVKHYADELAFKLSKGDTKAAGRIANGIIDSKGFIDFQRYEAKGLPISPALKFKMDITGVNIYKQKLDADRQKQITDLDNHIATLSNEFETLHKNNPQYMKDGNFVNAPQELVDKANELVNGINDAKDAQDKIKDDPDYWAKRYELQRKTYQVLNDHPEFKKQQIGRLIGDVISKHLTEVQKSAGNYQLTDEMILKAGEEAGIPKEFMKGISSDDIPNATILNQAFGGLYEEGINLGAGVGRFLGGVIGLDKDYVDAYISQAQERAHNRFKPADSELFEGAPTIVNENPISDDFLQDERNPDRGKSNYKFSNITQTISKKTAGFAAMIIGSKGLSGYAEKFLPGITEAANINKATATAEELTLAAKAQQTMHNYGLATYMIGSNYERHYQDATKFISDDPQDEAKRGVYSLLMGGLDYLAMTLPTGKYEKAAFNPAKEEATMEIGKTIKNTPNFPELDAVHKEVLRQNLEKYITTVIGNTTKEGVKFAGGMTAGIVAGKLINHVFGENQDEVEKSDQRTGDEIKQMLEGLPMMMIPIGMGEAMSYKQNSQVYKEMLADLGMNPKTYLSNITERIEGGQLSKEEGRQKAEVVSVMKKIMDNLPDTSPVTNEKLTHEERVEYAYNKFRERGLEIDAAKVKEDDPLLYKHYTDKISILQKKRDDILNKKYSLGQENINQAIKTMKEESFAETIPSEDIPQEKKVTDDEYQDFIDKGTVTDQRLNDIADKVKNKEPLTNRETEIFTDKTADINKIIAKEPVVTKPASTEEINTETSTTVNDGTKAPVESNTSVYGDITDDQTVKDFTTNFTEVNSKLKPEEKKPALKQLETHIGSVLQDKAGALDSEIPADKLPEATNKFISEVIAPTGQEKNWTIPIGKITDNIVKEFSSPKSNQDGNNQNLQGQGQRRPEEAGQQDNGQTNSEGNKVSDTKQSQAPGNNDLTESTSADEGAGTSPSSDEVVNKARNNKQLGVYSTLKNDEILKEISKQAQNIQEDGSKSKAQTDQSAFDTTVRQFAGNEDLVKAAIQKYPESSFTNIPEQGITKKQVDDLREQYSGRFIMTHNPDNSNNPNIRVEDQTTGKVVQTGDSRDPVKIREAIDDFIKKNPEPKTQKEKVKNELAKGDPKTIKEIAEVTKILEPNVRRILGVGAKDGEFKRTAKGVYVLSTEDGKQTAFIQAGDAVESVKTMADAGEKFDSVFLDPAYYSRSLVQSANRGIKFDTITPIEFVGLMKNIARVVKTDDTHVYLMLSGAKTTQKDMAEYAMGVYNADFKLVGEGTFTKTFKDDTPVTNVTGKTAAPERLLLFTKSGEARAGEIPINLNFRFLRPSIKTGYQTEKPKELLNAIIRQSTLKGESVLDPFAGSGVTGEQAIEAGRNPTLVEKNADVVENTIKPRVKAAIDEKNKSNNQDNESAAEEPSLEESAEDEAFRKAKEKWRKARKSGTLSSGGLNAEQIEAGAELLAMYIKRGIKKFADIIKDLIDSFGKEYFDEPGEVEAIKFLYNGERGRQLKESRKDFDSEDAIDEFIDNQLPKLLNDGTEQSNRPMGGTSKGLPERAGSADVQGPEIIGEAGRIPATERTGSPSGTEQATAGGDGLPVSEGDSLGNSYSTTGGAGENIKENELLGGTSKKDIAPKKIGEGVITPVRNGRNLVIPPDFEPMATFNLNQKYDDNIAAIKTLLDLIPFSWHLSREVPTKEQQASLFKYVGFGGLKEILFDPKNSNDWSTSNTKYRDKVKQIHELAAQLEERGLKDPIASIKKSVQNAHFTSIPVIRGMYSAIQALGFDGGKVLDPSAGVGHFYGAMPWAIAKNSDLSGIEIDEITGNILKSLYPDARIAVTGFEEAGVPNNYFDLTISNIPFGNVRIFDPELNKSKKPAIVKAQTMVHTYFFAKGLEVTRPGGLIAFITSNGILDSKGNEFLRKHIADSAEFLGAVRLPNTAFKANANTEVVTDMIFLRKFNKGEKSSQKYDFINILPGELKHKGDGGKETVEYNQFFHDHPEYMFGTPKAGGLYRRDEFTLTGDKNADLEKQITEATAKLFPEPIYTKDANAATDPDEIKKYIVSSASDLKSGNLVVTKDNKIGRLKKSRVDDDSEQGTAEPITSKFPVKQVKDFIKLRDDLNTLFANEISGEDEAEVVRSRNKLNTTYDNFVKNYGQLSAVKNRQLLSLDVDGYNVGALEKMDKDTGKIEKADIFEKRTLRPFTKVIHSDSPEDAIITSLNEKGYLDQARISSLLNKPFDKIYEENKGRIFEAPDGGWVTTEEYLSGNVKKKLAEAEQAAAIEPRFQFNVDALKEVIPADIRVADIEAKIGVRWIDPKYYDQFAKELFNTKHVAVKYLAGTDTYKVNNDGDSPEELITYGTGRMRGSKILNEALHGRTPQIFDTIDLPGGKEQRILNPVETAKAIEKFNLIKEKFANWIWNDTDRREILGKKYNDLFNNTVKRKYDGAFLTLPGLNSNIIPNPHQKDAVWMLSQNNGGIIDHIVGSGKTYIIVMTAMEKKRMGITKKPMILALKSTVPQIVEAFKDAYPLAKVLSPRETDFTSKNRKAMLAQIANNDWDAVVISHENYGFIPHDVDIQSEIIMDEVHALDLDIDALRDEEGSLSKQQLKGLEVRKQNLMAKLQELTDRPVDKELRTFQQLGVDDLYVDESQQFKNLAYSTKLRGIAGLGSPKGSKRSFNLLYGIRSLQQVHRGDKGTTFLSGTPISNTIVEMYLLLKYLRPDKMEEIGMKTFDSWVKNFADNSVDIEFAVTGALKMKDRFRDFINIPELSILYNEVTDVRNDRNLKLEKPKYKTGQRILKNVKQSDEQKEYTQKLIHFAETKDGNDLGLGDLSDGQKKAAMLLATNLSAKMAIDMRLIDPDAADNPTGKLSEAANTIAEHYFESTPHLGTQFVFSDVGTPKTGNTVQDLKDLLQDVYKMSDEDLRLAFGEGDKNPPLVTVVKRLNEVLEYPQQQINDWIDEAKTEAPFNVYDELKKKLIERGVPADQVVFIHSYKTSKAKYQLFEDMKAGKVRIAIGSTQKLGTGVNAQRRMIAIHHIDAPWRPSDMEQRDGRGIRQGNEITKNFYNNELPVYINATEGTLDAYKYQLLSIKQAYIDQVKTGAVGQRTFSEGEGDEESGMGYSEYVSILSGNPDILDKARVDKQVQGLNQSKRNFDQEKFDAESIIKQNNIKIDNNKLIIDNLQDDKDFINNNSSRDEAGDIEYKIKIGDQEFDKPGEAGKEILKKINENRDNTKKVIGAQVKIGEIAGLDIMGQATELFRVENNNKMHYEYYLQAPSGNTFNITLSPTTSETWAGRAPYEALSQPDKRLKVLNDNNDRLRGKIEKYQEIAKSEWPKQQQLTDALEKQKELQQRLNDAATSPKSVAADEDEDVISGLENPVDIDEEIRKAKEEYDLKTKGQLNSGIPLNALPQLLRLAFLYAKKGLKTAAQFAKAIGAKISKELVKTWESANKEHKDYVKSGVISINFKKLLDPLMKGGGKKVKQEEIVPPKPVWDKANQTFLEHTAELDEWNRKYIPKEINDIKDYSKIDPKFTADPAKDRNIVEGIKASMILMAKRLIKSMPAKFKDSELQENVYHHMEDDSIKLSPIEEEFRDRYVIPMQESLSALYHKIKGQSPELEEGMNVALKDGIGYVPREVRGKGGAYEKAKNNLKNMFGGKLKTTSSHLKDRLFKVLTDEAKNEQFVIIKNGTIYKSSERGAVVLGKFKKGDNTFIDSEGKEFTVRDATVKEVEANSSTEYYKYPLANFLNAFIELKQVDMANAFIDNMKESLQDDGLMIPVKGNVPKGFSTTSLRNFQGFAFPDKIAAELNRLSGQDKADPLRALTSINQFLRNSIVFGLGIKHWHNEVNLWLKQGGISRFAHPYRLAKTSMQAARALALGTPEYYRLMERGGSLMSHNVKNYPKLLLDATEEELKRDTGLRDKIAGLLGYANPLKLMAALSNFSHKSAMGSHDLLMMQAVFEHMDKGHSLDESIDYVNKYIPDYDIPSTIMGSENASKLIRNPNITMFSAYHFDVFKSYGNMIKDLVTGVKDMDAKKTAGAIDKLAMCALITAIIYPVLDSIARSLFGDKDKENNRHTQLRRAGSSKLEKDVVELSTGQMSLKQFIYAYATPAQGTELVSELITDENLNPYSEQKPYISSDITQNPIEAGKDILKFSAEKFAPYGQAQNVIGGRKTIGDMAEDQVFDIQHNSSPERKKYNLIKYERNDINEKIFRLKMRGKTEEADKINEDYKKRLAEAAERLALSGEQVNKPRATKPKADNSDIPDLNMDIPDLDMK